MSNGDGNVNIESTKRALMCMWCASKHTRALGVSKSPFEFSLWMKNHHSKWVRFKRKLFTFFFREFLFGFVRWKNKGLTNEKIKCKRKRKRGSIIKVKSNAMWMCVCVCYLLFFFSFISSFSAANSMELKGKMV